MISGYSVSIRLGKQFSSTIWCFDFCAIGGQGELVCARIMYHIMTIHNFMDIASFIFVLCTLCVCWLRTDSLFLIPQVYQAPQASALLVTSVPLDHGVPAQLMGSQEMCVRWEATVHKAQMSQSYVLLALTVACMVSEFVLTVACMVSEFVLHLVLLIEVV